ncbi:Centrosomal protein of 55 kDa [Acipenser ruthenus]|uniref:Centrosomal protein of 55 kDa n=1 Tax=Acipenser ruthenus TaxID=7906 RepID=A0A444UII9_ACIRT|nr:Centrosomal protein of 55 kDa [Acipenser ruthenus]
MTSRNAKAAITSKLGIKLGVSKSDTEIDKLRKENALLKKTMDEISKRKGKLTDMERNQLLETILKLETLKEKNTQQLAAKENEVITLRQQLKQNGDVVTLRAQLAEKNKEAERREQLFKSLAEETESVKNKYAAIAAKCQEFENQVVGNEVSSQALDKNQQWLVYDQQREAYVKGLLSTIFELEQKLSQANQSLQQRHKEGNSEDKNQQWLVYDQQREAYVKGLLSTIFELEQKLSQANQSLQQRHKEGNSEENNPDKKQEYHDKVLLTAKKDLEAQKTTVSQLQHELSELRKKYDQQSREVKDLNLQLHSERINSRQYVDDEKKRMGDKVQRLKEELENAKVRFEEERKRSSELSKRSSDLSSQVNLLQKSLLSQQEEQTRIAVLEQQIHMSTKDFESEKLDRQSLQQQLHKVLKELRKAREQITRLETTKQLQEFRLSEPSCSNTHEFDQPPMQDPALYHTSSPKISNLLDESFLECPRCRAKYPTSRHRLAGHPKMGFNQSYQPVHRDKQSYFAFFNEFRDPYKIFATSLETLVLLILFVVSFVGNVSAIVVVAKDKKPVNKNFFVLNLFFADLLFVSTIPLIISIRWTEAWALGSFACHMLFYVMSMSGCVTIITLATISLERMIAILKLQVAPVFNVKLVSSALASIWIFSASTSLPLCLFFNVMTIITDSKEVKICTLMWPSEIGEIVWDIAFTGLDFVIPGLIIVTSYTKILQRLDKNIEWKHNKG